MTSTTPQCACEGVEPVTINGDEEIERAAKQAFTAYEMAMRRGHHPRLWQVVKGSPFEALYQMSLGRRH